MMALKPINQRAVSTGELFILPHRAKRFVGAHTHNQIVCSNFNMHSLVNIKLHDRSFSEKKL